MSYISVKNICIGVASALIVAVVGFAGLSEFSGADRPVAADTRLGRVTLGALPMVRLPWRTAKDPSFSVSGKLVSAVQVGHVGLALSIGREYCTLTILNNRGHQAYEFQSHVSSGNPFAKSAASTNRPISTGGIIPGGPYTVVEEANLRFSDPALENVTIACGRSAIIWILHWRGESQIVNASIATTTVVPNYKRHKLTLGIVGSVSMRSAITRHIGSGTG